MKIKFCDATCIVLFCAMVLTSILTGCANQGMLSDAARPAPPQTVDYPTDDVVLYTVSGEPVMPVMPPMPLAWSVTNAVHADFVRLEPKTGPSLASRRWLEYARTNSN
jgi:hypothetical protein